MEKSTHIFWPHFLVILGDSGSGFTESLTHLLPEFLVISTDLYPSKPAPNSLTSLHWPCILAPPPCSVCTSDPSYPKPQQPHYPISLQAPSDQHSLFMPTPPITQFQQACKTVGPPTTFSMSHFSSVSFLLTLSNSSSMVGHHCRTLSTPLPSWSLENSPLKWVLKAALNLPTPATTPWPLLS